MMTSLLRYLSFGLLMCLAGIMVERNQLLLAQIVDEMLQVRFYLFEDPWYIKDSPHTTRVITQNTDKIAQGLIKLVHFSDEKSLAVSVINNDGELIHQWPINWFDLWPNPDHLLYSRKPKSLPGTMVHGAEITAEGDLIFNFEYLGMVRVDACGSVRWRLPELSHHSIFIDEQQHIWTSINQFHHFPKKAHALHGPYYTEPFIAKISSEGKVLEKKSLLDILEHNHYYGALYLSSLNNTLPSVKGDTLHINDVEIFPNTMEEGFFKTGDIMVSLRNINTILIIEPNTWRIKHAISHTMLRQHDPDFLDGSHIAVFDNNNRFKGDDKNAYSRILRIQVPSNAIEVVFQGNREMPFYTATLGKQQWLDNGNILFTDNERGHVLEITAEGETVWQFANLIKPNKTAAVQEAQRLPLSMDKAWFSALRERCQEAH